MKKFHRIIALGGSLFLLASAAQATASLCDATAGNLVQNCGFETGDFTAWNLSGINVPADLGNGYGVEQGQDPDGNNPNSGQQQAWFGELVPNAVTLSQSLGTVSGDSYAISFFLAQDGAPADDGRYGVANQLSASFGGVSLVLNALVPMQGYTEYTYTADASSSLSSLSLSLGNNTGYFLLDDVSVVDTTDAGSGPAGSVPEPASLALVATAFAGFFVSRRQRRR